MIPRAFVTAWRAESPWVSDARVEQDLIISRAIVEIFSSPLLSDSLAFRGGTALHKLVLRPVARYSEDIDLVQLRPELIGGTLNYLHSVLDPIFGRPRIEASYESVKLIYRMESEIPPVVPMRLKIEVNTREHFSVFGVHRKRYAIESGWHPASVIVTTYSLEELLGTKLRALYQRRKGRDLFDLWLGLTRGEADAAKVIQAFQMYLASQGLKVSQEEFRRNLEAKMRNRGFLGDLNGLLRPEFHYDPEPAYEEVDRRILSILE